MGFWFWAVVSISFLVAACLAFLLPGSGCKGKRKGKLPPGPAALPIIGHRHWVIPDVQTILTELRSLYGPIFTLRIEPRPFIIISDHSLAHEALVAKGPTFADRPPQNQAGRILSANQHTIHTAGYGPLWRLLRRNLVSQILHPSRLKSYADARNRVLGLLIRKLKSESQREGSVVVMRYFHFAVFSLLVFMCFGQRLDKKAVTEIAKLQRELILSVSRLNALAFFPWIGKLVFLKRWNELSRIRQRQAEVLLPLNRRARELINTRGKKEGEEKDELNSYGFSYVDSLLSLEVPEDGGRKLTEDEIISLCTEFLKAGTDSTATAMEWIMANIVKHPQIQEKLAEEIEAVVRERRSPQGGGGVVEENAGDFIREEELQKMRYLKAVVMEALRRHPPGSFVLPHAVKEEVEIDGYVIPKEASINFMVAEMGMDERVWKEPMEFRPERFLEAGEEVDITGNREIKMMPFGAGRRICPGLGLAMLHLEWFVANLVKEFVWRPKQGQEVDLTERMQFTVVMKNSLEVVLIQRKMREDAVTNLLTKQTVFEK